MSDTTLRIDAKRLGKELKARGEQTPTVLMAGMKLAAERGRTLLARETPVDTGAMKARWRVASSPTELALVNDAPYAGVVEGGARPHAVSLEGRYAIKLWFMRKVGLTEKEAAIRTEAFCLKLLTKGWPGKFFIRACLPQLNQQIAETVAMTLDAASRRPAGGP